MSHASAWVADSTRQGIGASQRTAAPRILLAKVGLDGHDRGIKVVARGLRDSGFHVIYGGIWQTPQAVAQAAVDEDVEWLGLSLLNGAHMTLVPRVLDEVRQRGLDQMRVLLGGIIPPGDLPRLQAMGVEAVFGPGSSVESISQALKQTPARQRNAETAALVSGCEHGDRLALSQLLTRIADGEASQSDFPERLRERDGRSRTIAVTGSPGVGKSSLISRLVKEFRDHDLSVAVLACDPQSPLSGGALLGDRIRMADQQPDSQLLIRSLAVPSGQQAIALHLDLMIRALELFGFDVILIESVGAGQGDTAIRNFADQVVVLVQPEAGDAVQWEKAGMLEIADVIVLHKSDLPGAERLEAELQQHLNVPGARTIPIVPVSAAQRTGVSTLREIVIPSM